MSKRTFSSNNLRLLLLHTRPSPRTTIRFGINNSRLNAHLQHARHASTNSVATDARSLVTRLKNLFFGTSIVLGLAFGSLYVTDTRSGVHRWLFVPSLRMLYDDAEDAHEAGTRILRALHDFGFHPRERGNEMGDLRIEVFGQVLDNPIGTSAGIDKNAMVPSALLALGPSLVEIGGITPLPQEGNPKPRVWRIPSQNALINRYGLNSAGAKHVATQLRQRVRQYARSVGLGIDENAERIVLNGEAGVPPGALVKGKMLAIQIAKNKMTSEKDFDAVRRDYVSCVEHVGKYADVIVVNVSSPNTPGLRSLQRAEPLQHILSGVVGASKAIDRATRPRIMVKVSPDEDSEQEVLGICQAVWASGIDGVIVGNTTKKRPDPLPAGYDLPAKEANLVLEQGGYSGPQMFGRTVALVKKYRKILDEALLRHPEMELEPKVIFATGGITNGVQALEVLNAGASIAQVYTALVYSGVGTVSRIKNEMIDEIHRKSIAKG